MITRDAWTLIDYSMFVKYPDENFQIVFVPYLTIPGEPLTDDGNGSRLLFVIREKTKMEKELDRLKRRLQASKKSLHDTEIRTRNLDASLQTVFRAREPQKENHKR